MIELLTCQCGSVEQRARGFLKRIGYAGWMSAPLHKGKERSKRAIQYLPKFPEIEMLNNFLENASKYVVILGYDDNGCRWADIAHGLPKSEIDAEFIVQQYGDLHNN